MPPPEFLVYKGSIVFLSFHCFLRRCSLGVNGSYRPVQGVSHLFLGVTGLVELEKLLFFFRGPLDHS